MLLSQWPHLQGIIGEESSPVGKDRWLRSVGKAPTRENRIEQDQLNRIEGRSNRKERRDRLLDWDPILEDVIDTGHRETLLSYLIRQYIIISLLPSL